jgi:ABC-2 type transport system ATP-binding protein
MADRIGVINKGEIIVVEEKDALLRKLGKRKLTLHLVRPLEAIPAELAGRKLELSHGGSVLEYTFDKGQEADIASLLRQLGELHIEFKDLQSTESSLEEIFVSLVKESS